MTGALGPFGRIFFRFLPLGQPRFFTGCETVRAVGRGLGGWGRARGMGGADPGDRDWKACRYGLVKGQDWEGAGFGGPGHLASGMGLACGRGLWDGRGFYAGGKAHWTTGRYRPQGSGRSWYWAMGGAWFSGSRSLGGVACGTGRGLSFGRKSGLWAEPQRIQI